MNEKMRAILGKHYEGHQIVSTQVAFYGLSSALLPETDFYKNKQKFLEFFKVEELLFATTIERQINPTIKEIKDKQPETYSNLDRSGDKFVSNLRNSVSKETAIQI
ncbi:hypothetical protein HpMS27_06600 [Helicobacter pylori]